MAFRGSGFRVQGSGFRVQGQGFMTWCLGEKRERERERPRLERAVRLLQCTVPRPKLRVPLFKRDLLPLQRTVPLLQLAILPRHLSVPHL